MAKISKKDVTKTAALAKLDLSDSEVSKFSSQLESVLSNFSSVDKIETEGVEVSAQVTGMEDVMVDDKPDKRIEVSREELLSNAPVVEDGYIVVPKVL